MSRTESSCLVMGELGSAWLDTVSHAQTRFDQVVFVTQWEGESAAAFAHRSAELAHRPRRFDQVVLCCNSRVDHAVLGARHLLAKLGMRLLSRDGGREFEFVCHSGRDSRVPAWAYELSQGMSECDRSLNVVLTCDDESRERAA